MLLKEMNTRDSKGQWKADFLQEFHVMRYRKHRLGDKTVKELQEVCNSYNLSGGGKKLQLISRICKPTWDELVKKIKEMEMSKDE